jgi:hypothetical protein
MVSESRSTLKETIVRGITNELPPGSFQKRPHFPDLQRATFLGNIILMAPNQNACPITFPSPLSPAIDSKRPQFRVTVAHKHVILDNQNDGN